MPHFLFLNNEKTQARLTTISADDKSVAFLPLSACFSNVLVISYVYGIELYQFKTIGNSADLKEIRPTPTWCSAAILGESICRVQENISKMILFMMGIVTWAVATGKKHNLDYLR